MRWLMVVVLVVALSGCAVQPKHVEPNFFGGKTGINNSRVFPSSMDAVWGAVTQVVTEAEYPLKVIEKDSGILSTDWIMIESNKTMGETNDVGGVLGSFAEFAPVKGLFGDTGIWNRCRYQYSINISQRGPTTTSVQINPHIECYEKNSKKDWLPCGSKGVLENQFFQALESKLGVVGN